MYINICVCVCTMCVRVYIRMCCCMCVWACVCKLKWHCVYTSIMLVHTEGLNSKRSEAGVHSSIVGILL